MSEAEVVVPRGFEVQYESWKIAPGLRAGDTLYCSGQLGTHPDGSLPDDLESQLDNAFRAVGAVLAGAGFSFSDVVELTSFHVGLREQLETFTRVRDRYLAKPYPAQTAVGVAELGLSGALVELRAIAVRPRRKRRA